MLGGVSRNAVSHWERGLTEPDFATLEQLADFYDVTIDWLFGRQGAERDSPRIQQIKHALHAYLGLVEDGMMNTTPEERLRLIYRFVESKHTVALLTDRLARRLGVNPKSLRDILSGKDQAGPLVIRTFSDVFGIPEGWFYVPQPTSFGTSLEPYRKAIQIARAIGLMPDDLLTYLEGASETKSPAT